MYEASELNNEVLCVVADVKQNIDLTLTMYSLTQYCQYKYHYLKTKLYVGNAMTRS